MPIPPNFFSVDFYDLKSMSFKFGNDIFITFEMPRSSFLMIFWKKKHFIAIPSICNQRSLAYNMPRYKEKAKICWVESENADRSSNTFIMPLRCPKCSQTKLPNQDYSLWTRWQFDLSLYVHTTMQCTYKEESTLTNCQLKATRQG